MNDKSISMLQKVLSGVVVFIDDDFEKDVTLSSKKVLHLYNELERSYLVVKFANFPTNGIIEQFDSVGLILLDWNLNIRPEEVMQKQRELFLKAIANKVMSPIFIFSNLDEDSVRSEWDEMGLKHNPGIYFQHKEEIDSLQTLLKKIEERLKTKPSWCTLRGWSYNLRQAEKEMFTQMSDIEENWVKPFYLAAKNEGSDPGFEIQSLLFTHLQAHCPPLVIGAEEFQTSPDLPNADCVNKLYQARLFLEYKDNKPLMYFTGDLFVSNEDNEKYYINIKPQCDCIIRPSKSGEEEPQDPLQLYVVEARLRSSERKDLPRHYVIKHFNGKVLQVNFKTLEVVSVDNFELKVNRVGRFLHPLVTDIVHKFADFIQRAGLPSEPKIEKNSK